MHCDYLPTLDSAYSMLYNYCNMLAIIGYYGRKILHNFISSRDGPVMYPTAEKKDKKITLYLLYVPQM